MFFVYIVRCNDGTYYIGYSTDVTKRVHAHNEGKRGARYTKMRRPVSLCYTESYATKTEALKREYQLKQLSKTQKERLFLV